MADNRQDIRIVVAGHVDHGKSTVIGRLLADTGSLPDGKLEQIREKCRRTARPFEYAFLLDALKDEQSQGVTIDSARCFFKTPMRSYIIIDAPGHTEFIKNMVTGASRAEAAAIVIDAAEGIQGNSKRHGIYLSMLGIKQVCVLVNKMDLVGYSEERYREIVKTYTDFLATVNLVPQRFIPVSGMCGDNIAAPSAAMPWYAGQTFLDMLEAFEPAQTMDDRPFRMPVQDVYKFTGDGDQRRIVAGTVEAGRLCVGDEIVFYPSEKRTRVQSIEAFHAPRQTAVSAGYATGFTLADPIYIQKGELAVRAGETEPLVGNHIRATLFWLGKKPVKEGDRYLLKTGETKTQARISDISRVMDGTGEGLKTAKQINRYEIAECTLTLDRAIAFDTSKTYPSAGRFVIVDDYDIAGGGILLENLRRAAAPQNPSGSNGKVIDAERFALLGQKGLVLWFTGLSGAGKTTIAVELERRLIQRGRLAYRLDGDNIRNGLNANLGFLIEDRTENIRRISQAARLFEDCGIITLVSFISPLRNMRSMAKNVIGEDHFIEIYVKAPLETCIQRDVKGLYQKALHGEIKNFTGISSPYEEPDCPDLVLETDQRSIEDCVQAILDFLDRQTQKTGWEALNETR